MNTILESDLTMATSISFSAILDEIQKSNLNFKIELSPFSAVVILKKTPIKDRKGIFAIPSPPSSFLLLKAQKEIIKLSQTIANLESENYQLKWDKASTVDECNKLNIANDNLKHKLDAKNANIKVEEDFLRKASETQFENEALKVQLRKLESITAGFNKKLAEARLENDEEKAASKKSFKKEIKQWKKELGTEKKLRINLEKKVKNLTDKTTSKASPNLSPASPSLLSAVTSNHSASPEVFCNLCAEPIPNYIPKFFHENEINPACNSCYEHSDDSENSENSEAKSNTGSKSSFENPLLDPSISTLTNDCQNSPISETMMSVSTFLPQSKSLQIFESTPPGSSAGFPPSSRTTTATLCTAPDFPPQRKPPF